MKNLITSIVKPTLAFLLLLPSLLTQAQKLPNVQKVSLLAPDSIKIDGNTKEWNDQFQAYNKATGIYYTLSNTNENIYLTVKVKSNSGIPKIIYNGLCLTINHTLNKKDISPVVITYPVLQRADGGSVSSLYNINFGTHHEAKEENPERKLNNSLGAKSKFISIKGIKDIAEENISVYNDQGIKAVSKFDKSLAYIYELVIPLKYLALPNNGADGFSYHIKLKAFGDLLAPPVSSVVAGRPNLPPPPPPESTYLADTDFWGEYTLAKK